MEGKIRYGFSGTVWQYNPPGGWFFVTLPENLAKEIRTNLKWQEEGWGRLKAIAAVGKTEWDTAIWFDTKANSYLLPLKAEIRSKEKIEAGKKITVVLWV